ncbi:uncharacterized protein FIBRA_07918 [Fibroporia radiculosa]|uniref:Uncharacterized protein n=1 Tax=Fibroporia radiculosa TaxID=599839 RepID=J4I1N8_9APHY|nr:uncharacterized protein FIBRA_07918 [Fibroporia radiculosa]CCM05687.1 predicted protein [Fibroporia radiculosa]
MPMVKRTEAIQAKYNVTVDFPHLGLHSAAATGDLGLVKYALEHGQPINSVLDGVLPLHAACSGGNDLVVRLLIEKGADVNAPRLPRRYFSERFRDASAPIVGTSGSTPLHFACANGHTNVVLTLLMHGAHPDRTDKHGKTPEVLSRENGFMACADILQEWVHNKDRDLREREGTGLALDAESSADVKSHHHHSCSGSDCKICPIGKRLRVKRSIDHALNVLMPSLAQSHSSSLQSSSAVPTLETIVASPLIPTDGLGESALRDDTGTSRMDHSSTRRPSLPDVLDVNQTMPMVRRPPVAVTSSRRPRSAGTDAENTTTTHRVKGKVSLLNIFKKNNADIPGASESSSYASPTSSTSVSPSPVPYQLSNGSFSPSPNASPRGVASPSTEETPLDATVTRKFRGRLFSETTASHPPLAIELHRAMSDERLRTRTQSNQGFTFQPQARTNPSLESTSPPVKLGYLRPHYRSISSGNSQTSIPPFDSVGTPASRALRFDSSSTSTSQQGNGRHSSHSPGRSVRTARSISSVRSALHTDTSRSPLIPTAQLGTSSGVTEFTEEPEYLEEDEQYDEPITSSAGLIQPDSRSSTLKVEGQSRRNSTISSHASLSPLPSPGIVLPSTNFDGPFNINSPPPEDLDSPTELTHLDTRNMECRLRGDSMSSMSTSGTSAYLTTPGLQHPQLPPPHILSSVSTPPEFPAMDYSGRGIISRAASSSAAFPHDIETTYSAKGLRAALDIDIRSISTHAQAEALVQRAQRSILEMQEVDVSQQVPVESAVPDRTPLSAKLAAYGESLALERKLKQEEQGKRGSASQTQVTNDRNDANEVSLVGSPRSAVNLKGLDRKYSLEERSHGSGTVRQSRTKRPHTSGGSSSSDMSQFRPGDGPHSSVYQLSAPVSHVASSSSTDLYSRMQGNPVTPPRSSHLKTNSEFYRDARPRLNRSYTPEPGSDVFPSPDSTTGAPLSRICTAPTDSYPDFDRKLSSQERHAARVNKLAKMGFSSPSPDPRQSSTAGSRSHPGYKQRLGGLKGFVQNLQLMGK